MYTGLKVATFQQRFASLFDESGKTTTELAKSLHVSYQTISAWKIGTRSPKLPTATAIAEYFGVKVEWLMGFDVEKKEEKLANPIIIYDSELFRKIMENMTPDDYELVMGAFERTFTRMRESGDI